MRKPDPAALREQRSRLDLFIATELTAARESISAARRGTALRTLAVLSIAVACGGLPRQREVGRLLALHAECA